MNIISRTDQHLGLSFTWSLGKISVIKCKKGRRLVFIFRQDHLIPLQKLAHFKTQTNRIIDCLYAEWREKFKLQDAMFKCIKMCIVSKTVIFTNLFTHQQSLRFYSVYLKKKSILQFVLPNKLFLTHSLTKFANMRPYHLCHTSLPVCHTAFTPVIHWTDFYYKVYQVVQLKCG